MSTPGHHAPQPLGWRIVVKSRCPSPPHFAPNASTSTEALYARHVAIPHAYNLTPPEAEEIAEVEEEDLEVEVEVLE